MARQSKTPVQFQRSRRRDSSVCMTSGRAGKVIPLGYAPLLRGDSCSGSIGIDISLAEMPRPLLNAAMVNFQAWFVPFSAHPKFSGLDEFMHSYQGENIEQLGAAARTPPAFFDTRYNTLGQWAVDGGHQIYVKMGIHPISEGGGNAKPHNSYILDTYNQIWNFRAAAHSSKIARRPYLFEELNGSRSLAPAFWPSGRWSAVVPDYEQALIVGSLDLDVAAGQIPVEGIRRVGGTEAQGSIVHHPQNNEHWIGNAAKTAGLEFDIDDDAVSSIFADMEGQTVGITLANLDKARQTQAFAKLRQAMAGVDHTGFNNDDALLAELMQGLQIQNQEARRPWLLDSKRVVVGMTERHATDSTGLDESVTTGRASAMLRCVIPQQEFGGIIMYTAELLPERLDERMSDPFMHMTDPAEFPNALRDVQRVEPVDPVPNHRIDARHSTPDGLFGYEPMNNVWNRSYTRLGGAFYQDDPSNPWTEQRSAIWQTGYVNPTFSNSHYLAPDNFPHDVFSDTTADAFEAVARHEFVISGLTQIGDVLAEDNNDYSAIEEATAEE